MTVSSPYPMFEKLALRIFSGTPKKKDKKTIINDQTVEKKKKKKKKKKRARKNELHQATIKGKK